MTDILVLADTHLTNPDHLPDALLSRAEDCDLIVHCGDIDSMAILECLDSITRTLHVRGNCDTAACFDESPEQLLFERNGRKIGVLHTCGKKIPPQLFLPVFHPIIPDIVLFGHTHRRFAKTIKGTFFLNPGSATMPKDTGRSFAILSIDEHEIQHEFVIF